MSDDSKQPIDRLIAGARIAGATRIIPEGTPAADVDEQQGGRVMELIAAWLKRTGIKPAEIARATGIYATHLSALLKGQFNGRWREHVIDLDHWLEDEAKREAAPKPTDFVLTRVAEEIFTVAEAAVTLKCIGLVFGHAGIGKTIALQAIAASKPGSALVSIRTAANSPGGVLYQIAQGVGLRDGLGDYEGGLMRRLEDLLKGTPRLIIIDEIHKLTHTREDRSLHVLRDLHDATGVPMLWCGTTDIRQYLERGQSKGREPLAQIRRRIGIARNLAERAEGPGGGGEPLYSVDEIRRVFAKSKMRLTPDAIRYLWMLANLPDSGALGTCRNLVVMAIKVGEASGANGISADMLRGVHRLLVSGRDYGLMQAKLEQSTATPPPRTARAG